MFKPHTIACAAQAALLSLAGLATTFTSAQPAEPGSAATLQPVQVTDTRDASALPASAAGGQVAKGARVGALGNRDVLETPFSTISYTEEFIRNQQATNVPELMAVNPSLRPNIQGFMDGEQYLVRGFPLAGDYSFDGLAGMMPGRTAIQAFERVELFKGPSAGVNGQSPAFATAGGTLNFVPKRAQDEPLTRITLNAQSASNLGAHADIGRRFGEQKEWGVRINAVHRAGDTWRDDQKNEAQLAALALDYRGTRLRASLDVQDERLYTDGASRVSLIGSGVTAIPKAPDGKTNFQQGWEYFHQNQRFAVLRADYDVTDQVNVYGAYGRSRQHQDYFSSNATITSNAGAYSAEAGWFPTKTARTNYEVGARGNFKTGAVTHAVSAVFTRFDQESGYNFGDIVGGAYTGTIYQPGRTPAPSDLGLDTNILPDGRTRLTSIGLIDTLGFLDNRLQVIGGVRRQTVLTTGYDKSKTTPVVAIVYKLTPELSVYGNHIESLQAGPTAPAGTSNAGQQFAPYGAKQRELGLKYQMGGMLLSTAVFQISQPNQRTVNNTFGLDGEQRNRGIEFEATGQLLPGLRLLSGFTLLQPKLTATAGGLTDGKDGIGAPRRIANVFADWDVPGMPGLALNAGVAYTSAQFYNAANTLSIPSWTRFDLGARYTTTLVGKSTTFRLNVLNVADKAYWASTGRSFLTLAAPRTVTASVSVDF